MQGQAFKPLITREWPHSGIHYFLRLLCSGYIREFLLEAVWVGGHPLAI